MNNGMISVPRDKLAKALKADASMGATAMQLVEGWAAMAELRALLAQPADTVLGFKVVEDPSMEPDTMRMVQPDAQHQGEPVVWLDPQSGRTASTISNATKRHNEKVGGAPASVAAMYTVPLCRCTADQPAPAAVVLPELTDDLRFILGRPNFTCSSTAAALRMMGIEIAYKSEDEQAAAIYWMLGHYLKDPEEWRLNANAELQAVADEARRNQGAVADGKARDE